MNKETAAKRAAKWKERALKAEEEAKAWKARAEAMERQAELYRAEAIQARKDSQPKAETWGEFSQRIRQAASITQVELAKKANCVFATINRLEKGYHEPSLALKKTLKRIGRRYGLEKGN